MRSVEKDTMRLLTEKPGWGYWALVAGLGLVVGLGLVAWIIQLRQGLGVTGLSSEVMWGVYIVNFVFFVGISYAGTLLSAVLRLVGADWRRPVTRVAEIVTVAALLIAGVMIFADMGRPGVAPLNMLKFGRASSPLIWDMIVLSTYLVAALFFLFLPLIPDLARCRDHYREQGGWRYRFYRSLALAWNGNVRQRQRLEKAMAIIAVTIIPVAIMAHSVVAWIFGVTLRPVWNSSIFAPYFVVGAVFSGTAVIILVMALYRHFYGLGAYFTAKHFRYLGYILLTLNLAYMYFTFSEYLTIGYAVKADYRDTLFAVLSGSHAPWFWFAIILGMLAPAALVALPWTRTVSGISLASVLVVVGMWLKRWIIVVPPLEYGVTPAGLGSYTPTWIEWSITAAGLAGLALAFLVFQRLFPIISIWEVEHAAEASSSDPIPEKAVAAGVMIAAHHDK
jgi:Ni/Fe-hydrogenase subunit HybB-like protein